MGWKRVFATGLTLLALCGVGQAQEEYKQERVNLTIGVASFPEAAADLRELTAQFDADITNLNLHHDNTSGNVNIRVAPKNLSGFVAELATLGAIENQSQSVSDYTSNYLQYQQRLKTFRAMQELPFQKSFQSLPTESRRLAETELQNWLTNQVNSAESSLRSYKEQSEYAEVYVNFNRPPSAQQAKVDSPEQETTAEEPDPKPAPQSSPSPEFFLLCLLNMTGLWLIYRKVDKQSEINLD